MKILDLGLNNNLLNFHAGEAVTGEERDGSSEPPTGHTTQPEEAGLHQTADHTWPNKTIYFAFGHTLGKVNVFMSKQLMHHCIQWYILLSLVLFTLTHSLSLSLSLSRTHTHTHTQIVISERPYRKPWMSGQPRLAFNSSLHLPLIRITLCLSETTSLGKSVTSSLYTAYPGLALFFNV